MEALKYLNNIINNRSAFVPVNLTAPIVAAAAALGVTLCGGLCDPETNMRVLYVSGHQSSNVY